jgi:uncharacterized membrane protein
MQFFLFICLSNGNFLILESIGSIRLVNLAQIIIFAIQSYFSYIIILSYYTIASLPNSVNRNLHKKLSKKEKTKKIIFFFENIIVTILFSLKPLFTQKKKKKKKNLASWAQHFID